MRGALALVLLAAIARAEPPKPRALNVVVIVDREQPADHFALTRDAARELVAALGPEDRLAFIAVGGDLLSQSGSDEVPRERERFLRWLAALEPATGTMEIGLGPPLQMAESLLALTNSGTRSARIVLLSDGGHVAGFESNAELRKRVTDLARRTVRLDALSPGSPTVRPPLEALAELGNGRLQVLHVAGDAPAVLAATP